MGDEVNATFLAFDKNFKGGAYPAIGDINNDGKNEIVVGAGYGGGPQVRIFDKLGNSTGINFYAFEKEYTSGVNVAVCNLDNQKRNEIVVGKALEDKSEIRVYRITKKNKAKFLSKTIVYDENFEGGINIACSDLNNDEKDEIITGPGPTGRSHIRTFKYKSAKKKIVDFGLSFFAFNDDFMGGATVSAYNGKIVVGQATKGGLTYVYDVNRKDVEKFAKLGTLDQMTPKLVNKITAFKNFSGGINVALGKIDSGKAKILISPTSNGGPVVEIFNLKGKLLKNFSAYAGDFRGGVRIAVDGEEKDEKNISKKQEFIFVIAPGFKMGNKCEKNCVALTFDDGYTSASGSFDRILDILKTKKVHATFFMLGKVMQQYPDRMKRLDIEGHQLANHSYSHSDFTRLSTSQIVSEITYSNDIAKSITGKETKPYFRYPGGSHNASTDAIVKNMGYKYFGWTASAGDTSSNVTVQSATWGMLWNLHNGSIILGHTMKDQTAGALPTVIDAIRNAGYTLATLDEMSSYWGT
ncbi:MAG: polysaccharide deacetylase family protein [Patescibacteria group bacterium]|nr:polysaccharide deacetylase family protein [Patescibacteria group bacterium]